MQFRSVLKRNLFKEGAKIVELVKRNKLNCNFGMPVKVVEVKPINEVPESLIEVSYVVIHFMTFYSSHSHSLTSSIAH